MYDIDQHLVDHEILGIAKAILSATGSGTTSMLPVFTDGPGGVVGDSGYSWVPNAGTPLASLLATDFTVYSTAGTVFSVGADPSNGFTVLRDYATGNVTFSTRGGLVGSFTFVRNSSFTGTIAASNLSGTNTGDETATSIRALGAFTLDAVAQTLPATKRVTVAAVSPLEFQATSTGITPKIMSFWSNAATPIEVLTLYGPTTTGITSRLLVTRDTAGTERTNILASGLLKAYDGVATNTAVHITSSLTVSPSGLWTFSNAAPVIFQSGIKIGTAADGDRTLETLDLASADATVTWTQSATASMPARVRTYTQQNFAMDAVSNGVSRGTYWQVPAQTGGTPAATAIFAGTRGQNFTGSDAVSFLDAMYRVAYNTDGTTRFNTAEYAMDWKWEYTYDQDPTTNGIQAVVENNWDFTAASSGHSWRAFGFAVDTTANSGEGAAQWSFQPNNIADTSALANLAYKSAYFNWPYVAFNFLNTVDAYTAAAMSNYMRTSKVNTGATQICFQNTMILDHTTDLSGMGFHGITSQIDASKDVSTTKTGTVINFTARQPLAPAAGGLVGYYIGFAVEDLNLNRTGFGAGQAIYVTSQTTPDGSVGNMLMAGGGYKTGHYVAGATHLWEAAAGALYAKGSTPSSATDGYPLLPLYASGRSAAQTAAVASVAALTVGAADTSFEVSANVNVTTATLHNFTMTCAYTDETNAARTLTLGFTQLSGATLLTSITNVTGAGPYESPLYRIRCKAATTVTIATAGTFTTVTYNAEGFIKQAA